MQVTRSPISNWAGPSIIWRDGIGINTIAQYARRICQCMLDPQLPEADLPLGIFVHRWSSHIKPNASPRTDRRKRASLGPFIGTFCLSCGVIKKINSWNIARSLPPRRPSWGARHHCSWHQLEVPAANQCEGRLILLSPGKLAVKSS